MCIRDRFYSKMGFKEEKIVEDYYEDREDAAIMSKILEYQYD